VEWRLRAIRGATTVSENTVEAIREALIELLDEIEARNQQITTTEIIQCYFFCYPRSECNFSSCDRPRTSLLG
jgi:chorismate mutase